MIRQLTNPTLGGRIPAAEVGFLSFDSPVPVFYNGFMLGSVQSGRRWSGGVRFPHPGNTASAVSHLDISSPHDRHSGGLCRFWVY